MGGRRKGSLKERSELETSFKDIFSPRHTRVLGKIVVEQAYFRLQKKVDFTISSHFSCKIGLFYNYLAENSCKISVFWFSILQLFSKIVVFSNCEKRPILQLFSENSCKIREFFFC